MIQNKSAIIIALLACLNNAQAHDDKKSYVLMRLGLATNKAKDINENIIDVPNVKIKHHKTGVFGGSLGYYLSPEWRIALSMNYLPKWQITDSRNNNNNSHNSFFVTNVSSLSATIDNCYDFRQLSYAGFTPYIMAGLGISFNEISDSKFIYNQHVFQNNYAHNSLNFAYKLGTGINYKINNSAFIELGYSFNHFGKVTSKNSTNPPEAYIDNNNQEHIHELQSSMIFNKFKKLQSHQFTLALGLRF